MQNDLVIGPRGMAVCPDHLPADGVASLAGALFDPGSVAGIHSGENVVGGGAGGWEEQCRHFAGEGGVGDFHVGPPVDRKMRYHWIRDWLGIACIW